MKVQFIDQQDHEDNNDIDFDQNIFDLIEKNYEEQKIEEIDMELHKFNKQKKKKLEKEKKKKDRNDMDMKVQFIDQQDHEDNNDIDFDQNIFDLIKKNNMNLEDLEYKDMNKGEGESLKIPEQNVEEFDLSDFDEDEYAKLMNDDIESNMKMFDENKGSRRIKKKKKKKVEEDRTEEWAEIKKEKEEESTRRKIKEDGIMYMRNENDESASEADEEEKIEENEKDANEDSLLGEDSLLDDSIDDMVDNRDIIENPLRKKKNNYFDKKSATDTIDTQEPEINEGDNLSSDTDEEDIKMIGKKTKRENGDGKEDIPRVRNLESDSSDGRDSEFDDDEKAEIRAIAKKMLRKKDRLNILYKTYNRYAFNDLERAPEWFQTDEKEHNRANKPVTKDEITREKEIMKAINDRMPKKVLEAKSRKRNKLNRRMAKIKKQAQTISNQEEISEFSKVKQIEKLYKKEIRNNKEHKKYVVSRSSKIKTGKDSRSIKHVDKRMKKDKRTMKQKDKKKRKK